MSRIGIMQGRLVPPVNEKIQFFPREQWAEEFPRAAAAGLECIEWIYDSFGADVNPLSSEAGVARMKTLVAQHGVAVRSLCADYFMDFPLVRATESERAERLDRLECLLNQCRAVGITRVVLPFVDQSAIHTDVEMRSVVESLRRVLPAAMANGVELHLETSLTPEHLRELLIRLPSFWVKVNYDTGNSASLGYDPRAEFAAYGARVGSVHIKDRIRRGGTVRLGTGDVNFPVVFEELHAVGYSGDFILQVARDVPGDEVNWARRNRAFVLQYWRM